MTAVAERWEGAGNVYLIIDAATLSSALDEDRARAICATLGGDGILEVRRDDGADVSMRIWNPDGSQSEACGNGTRMVARWLSEQTGARDIRIASAAGVLQCTVDGDMITARLAPARFSGPQYRPTEEAFPYEHTFVSIGNPHVVIAVEDIEDFPLATEGPALEHHAWFPERANVEVMTAIGPQRVRMRVWERGVGETKACGTGACAVAAVAVELGMATSPVTVELPGGELVVEVGEDGAVTMTGPAHRLATIPVPAELV